MTAVPLQPVIMGMGFSKQHAASNLKEVLECFLQEHQYILKALAMPAFKQQDNNALQLQNLISIPVYYIPDKTLHDLQTKCLSYSAIVAKHTGLGAIAEACVLAIINENDHLLIPKIIYNQVTFSVAIKGDLS